MATLLSWTSLGIGDLDVFMPSPPCLVVYTSYEDGVPESSIMYIWQHEKTGALHHELVYQQAVPFETAVAWAQEHAPTRNVERIHVKQRAGEEGGRTQAKSKGGREAGSGQESGGQESGAGKAGRSGQGPKTQGIVGRGQ